MVGYLIAVAPAKFIPGLTYAGCFIAACGIYPGEQLLSAANTKKISLTRV
jgi:hypothetical protein